VEPEASYLDISKESITKGTKVLVVEDSPKSTFNKNNIGFRI
jgi:hypothetical protein